MLKPKWLLHAEGGAALLIAGILYRQSHGSWLLFALLFLVPDLFMFGYLLSKKTGAILYNLAHTYALPLLWLAAIWTNGPILYRSLGLIWIAHIGWDRLIGYGLKYGTNFKDTHLQRV
jgi:hypothetical protein